MATTTQKKALLSLIVEVQAYIRNTEGVYAKSVLMDFSDQLRKAPDYYAKVQLVNKWRASYLRKDVA